MTPPIVTPDTARRLKHLRQLGARKPSLHGYRGQHLRFDATGHQLVSTGLGLDGPLQWWDLRSGAEQPRVTQPLNRGKAAGFLPGRDTLVSVTVGGLLQEWSLSQGAVLREAKLDLFQPDLEVASQGEHLLLTSADGKALLWDVQGWRPLRALTTASLPFRCGTLSPDGALAVTGTAHDDARGLPGEVLFWDVATGAPRGALLIGPTRVLAVAFDASGRLLAAGTSAGEIHLIDTATRAVLRTLRGPAPGIRNLSFSPDGALLAVGGGMGCFLVVDVANDAWLYQHGDDNDFQSSHAVFSPDGRTLAWGQGDGTVGLWGVAE